MTVTKDNKMLNPSRILDLKKILYKSVLYFYLHVYKIKLLLCAIFPGTLYMSKTLNQKLIKNNLVSNTLSYLINVSHTFLKEV